MRKSHRRAAPAKAPALVETSRLRLEQPRAGDAPEIFARYASDPEVTRYLSWPRHRSLADTETFLALSAAEWERWPAGPYLIRQRSNARLLGGTGLHFETPERAVTGYLLALDAWGQGFATEALQAVVDMARQIGVVLLCALCHPDHRASQRVLEKCDFVRDTGWSGKAEYPNLAPGVALPTARYERTFGGPVPRA